MLLKSLELKIKAYQLLTNCGILQMQVQYCDKRSLFTAIHSSRSLNRLSKFTSLVVLLVDLVLSYADCASEQKNAVSI